MNIEVWLRHAQQKLEDAGIGTARLDVLVLLEDELNKSRTHLLAHPEIELSSTQTKVLTGQLARRAMHEPLAYIRNKTEFYGRDFIVTPTVLEPRPESETMIDLLKKHVQKVQQSKKVHIADVGTGSGALGITAKLELPNVEVDLLEIDSAAIEVAKRNVIKFATSTSVIKSDLLQNTQHNYDVLLCNLPYVPDEYTINKAAKAEPKLAIYGGSDGLDIYRQLFAQIDNSQQRPLFILCESLPFQHSSLSKIAGENSYKQIQTEDFIQVFTQA